jgi:Flp pilus assembly protein TadG
MRLMKIAAGGTKGAAEFTRMVQEKAEAAAAAQTAGSLALAKGRSVKAATKAAMAPVKKRVRANRKRLSRGR